MRASRSGPPISAWSAQITTNSSAPRRAAVQPNGSSRCSRPGERDEQVVAGVVAERGVDPREVVEVAAHHRDPLPAGPGQQPVHAARARRPGWAVGSARRPCRRCAAAPRRGGGRTTSVQATSQSQPPSSAAVADTASSHHTVVPSARRSGTPLDAVAVARARRRRAQPCRERRLADRSVVGGQAVAALPRSRSSGTSSRRTYPGSRRGPGPPGPAARRRRARGPSGRRSAGRRAPPGAAADPLRAHVVHDADQPQWRAVRGRAPPGPGSSSIRSPGSWSSTWWSRVRLSRNAGPGTARPPARPRRGPPPPSGSTPTDW